MALDLPIQELILRQVVTRLSEIDSALLPDTYYSRVRRVVRGMIHPDRDVGSLTLQVSTFTNSAKQYQAGGGPGGIAHRVMTLAVDAWLHKEKLTDTDSVLLAADIERAVMSDRKNAGLSECTYWQSSTIGAAPEEVAPTAYLRVTFTIEYRTAAGRPAAQVGT